MTHEVFPTGKPDKQDPELHPEVRKFWEKLSSLEVGTMVLREAMIDQSHLLGWEHDRALAANLVQASRRDAFNDRYSATAVEEESQLRLAEGKVIGQTLTIANKISKSSHYELAHGHASQLAGALVTEYKQTKAFPRSEAALSLAPLISALAPQA